MDRRQPEGLTGVDREPGVIGFLHASSKSAKVPRVGGLPASAPAMSKTDDAASGESHGQFGDLAQARDVAHRGDQAAQRRSAATLPGRVHCRRLAKPADTLTPATSSRSARPLQMLLGCTEPDLPRTRRRSAARSSTHFARDPFRGREAVCADRHRVPRTSPDHRSGSEPLSSLPEPRRQRLRACRRAVRCSRSRGPTPRPSPGRNPPSEVIVQKRFGGEARFRGSSGRGVISQTVTRSSTSGRVSGRIPIRHRPQWGRSAYTLERGDGPADSLRRPGVRGCTGVPATTASPGLACNTTPASACTAAPGTASPRRRQAATPTPCASRLISTPDDAARTTSRVGRPAAEASESPP